MQKVGTVQSIWRYPVKGMAGESMQQCHLSANGLLGDRTWAVQDLERQEIQSCKFRPDLLKCRASQRLDNHGDLSGQVDVSFPGGIVLGSDDPSVHKQVSDTIGYASTLQSLRPFPENAAFFRRHKADATTWLKELKATFTREPGEPLPDLDNLPPDMQEFVSLPGTFFLVSPFHILTSASLQHMQQINSNADWDVERFRPNLVIETLPGMEGLIEQTWLGKQLRIGDTTIQCTGTAPRCGAVTRAQANLQTDKSILRSIVQAAEQNLGIYGAIDGNSLLNVGEEVWLETL
ncbi:MOSC domain-containing protein [Halopseudomonas salina]|uniref:Molybdenum cofactor sulfurase n=1 Tax=Halopseudomonas salina TaxID=1323744 RepID=A0ABQ1PYL0_9GAMM|nr:MOSC N-terminal beta barrel domain-containing protein [Halopseudomonas salina]GGD07685.1 molybdenum cofactor sulfurase [Halopseudomonas salina]